MSFGGQTFRAFRPSRLAQPEELEEEHQEAKQAKIRIYIKRAEAGMPLFEQPDIAKALAAGQDLVM